MLSNMGAANTKLIFRQNDENLKSEILKEINKKENVFSEKDIAINNLKIELSKIQCILLYNTPGDIEEEKLKSWLAES